MPHSIWCRCSVSAAVNSATAMSFRSRPGPRPRPPFRGGRGRRGFSGRPWTPENQFAVSGDSHFESVRDANSRLQGGPSNNNDSSKHGHRSGGDHSGSRGGFRGVSDGPRPRSGPYFNPNWPSGARPQQSQPFYGNQQFRPPPPWQQHPNQRPSFQPQHGRPKSDDHRRWEYAKNLPPPQCERFVVLSYNILADYLASSHHKLYLHIPRFIMDWQRRRRSILFELGLWSPDIMCFQEVDKFEDLQDDLKHRGYMGTWKMRTGIPTDGCAIFWRISRFQLVHEESIEFNQFGLRDNVAQICVLQSLPRNDNIKHAASTSLNTPNKVVVCNIHVLFNPKRGEMKLAQVRVLLEKAHAVSKAWNDAPVVICGDFNCTPKSPLYSFLSEQKLDISGVDRDKVSGQESAEVLRTPKQYNPASAMNSNLHGVSSSEETSGGNSVGTQPASSVVVNSNLENTFVSHFSSDTSTSINVESNIERPYVDDKSLDTCSKSRPVEVHQESVSEFRREVVHDMSGAEVGSTSLEPSIELNSNENMGSVSSPGHTDQLPTNENKKAVEFTSSTTWGEDFYAAEKLEGLSLNELDGDVKDACDDPENFLSKLHGDEDAHLSDDLGSDDTRAVVLAPDDEDDTGTVDLPPYIASESLDVEKGTTPYDPSTWTPSDIAMATGNADCSLLEHPLNLRSTYTEVEGSAETRDSSGEPQVTSYHRCFLGTVDYIWRSEGLETVKVLAPLSKQAMLWTPGFPTKKWGSDHIALASELAFTKGVIINDDKAQAQ